MSSKSPQNRRFYRDSRADKLCAFIAIKSPNLTIFHDFSVDYYTKIAINRDFFLINESDSFGPSP
jgi:hypothetical protein